MTIDLSNSESESVLNEVVATLLELKETELDGDAVDETLRVNLLEVVWKLGGRIDWDTLDPEDY